jgi:hypothetical protein
VADTDRLILYSVRVSVVLMLLRASAVAQYNNGVDYPYCDDKDEGHNNSNAWNIFCDCSSKTIRQIAWYINGE